MDTLWIVIFTCATSFAGGFAVAAIMAAGSRADDQDELAREMMRRRGSEFTGDQGIES